jgi:shikimate kinase
MSLILITGISTSGKSTIAKELTKRGYEAYDTEHNGISAWYNKQTGARAAGFNEMPERTEEWLSQHEWLISTDWVAEMSEKAKNKPIFLCGGSANEPEIRAKCQTVIWLETNKETIRKRVSNPRDHDYGTKPHELALAIEANKRKEAEYSSYGAIMVDATQPIGKVVDEILTKVSSDEH